MTRKGGKEKQSIFSQMCLSLQTVLYCLQVEELQAQVVILWFGDSVGTKTLQGGSEVQVFSQGAFIVASNGA